MASWSWPAPAASRWSAAPPDRETCYEADADPLRPIVGTAPAGPGRRPPRRGGARGPRIAVGDVGGAAGDDGAAQGPQAGAAHPHHADGARRAEVVARGR